MSPLLEVKGLGKFYFSQPGLFRGISLHLLSRFRKFRAPYKIPVFDQVNFQAFPGECIAVRGPNGSGKSTLFRCIAGITHPTKGEIHKHGKVLAHLSHGFGAYEDLEVWRLMLLVQQLFGLSEGEALGNIEKQAELAGLTDRLMNQCSQLSEGMRAKIALTALAFCPFDVLLLDESLNHVDMNFRTWFFYLTRDWIKQGKSILITTHDDTVLEQFGTRHLQFHNKSLIPVR